MSIKDALLATIDFAKPGVQGRTLLQKRMYFLAVLVGEDFMFSPYYYGPYSSSVADHLGALCEAALVSEQAVPYAEQFGPFGELRRYDYRLTSQGAEVVDQRSDAVSIYGDALRKITSHAIADDPRSMSIAAKVHFIVSEHGQASGREIRQRASQLGWDVQPRQIERIVDYLEYLGLIKTRSREST